MAPEVLAGSYDEKCDIWSIGVMLYILLCGYPPFFATNEREILKKVKKGVYEFDPNDWSKISSSAKDLVKKMLHYEPKLRVSAKDAYNHAWFTNQEKTELNTRVLKRLSNFQMKNKLKMAIFEFISV